MVEAQDFKKIPKAADRILEQASGTGILTCKIARLFPKSRVIGVELHEEYLKVARKKVRDLDLSNVEFIHGRAEDVILKGGFDCIVSDYLAKYVDLDLLVAHAWRMLRKGGLLIMHELTRPTNPQFLVLWSIHFKFLQAYGNWKHPEWNMALNDVPFLLTTTRWVDELNSSLKSQPVFRYRDRKSDLWCIRYCISQKIALPLGANRAMDLNRLRLSRALAERLMQIERPAHHTGRPSAGCL